MGPTDAGCQGSDLYETPNIDRLARDGMRFTEGYAACTVCSPLTRGALMTGRGSPGAHPRDRPLSAGTNSPNEKLRVPDWTMKIEQRHTTMAGCAARPGYRTAIVGNGI
ncbi:MAG: sulfatase-like hydrolase/transferase [Bryobacterales bacterium]